MRYPSVHRASWYVCKKPVSTRDTYKKSINVSFFFPFQFRPKPNPLPVELDEHQVPDLQDVGVIHVHQVRGVSPSDAVIMDLAAGAAGASVSHLPEVILHAAWQDASLLHPECEQRVTI